MANITGINKVQDLLGDFEFNKFCIIDELRILYIENELCIKMFLSTEGIPPKYSIEMLFTGVSNAHIQPFQSENQFKVMGFDIIGISDNQLEGLSWQINDFEENSISWYCRDIEIVACGA